MIDTELNIDLDMRLFEAALNLPNDCESRHSGANAHCTGTAIVEAISHITSPIWFRACQGYVDFVALKLRGRMYCSCGLYARDCWLLRPLSPK